MSNKFGWCKNLKDKVNPNDKKMTPSDLAEKCISLVPFDKEDLVLDGFRGKGAFYNKYPNIVKKDWCEIDEDKDFFTYEREVDWLVSNPPYSKIQKVIEHSVKICRKGIALLIGVVNLSPKRIKLLEDNGFRISKVHICNVSGWFSNSVFFVSQKNISPCITYDPKPYNMPDDEMIEYKQKQKKYQEDYYKKNFKGKYKKFMDAMEILQD